MKRVLCGAIGTVILFLAACSSPAATAASVELSAAPADLSLECHSQQAFLEGSRGLVTLHMHAYADCMKAHGWVETRTEKAPDRRG